MRNSASITSFLEERGLTLAGPVVRQDSNENGFFCFIVVEKDSKGNQQPNNLKIKKISKELADEGVNIDFILNYKSNKDLDSGLRATLLLSFPDEIRNSFLEINDGAGDVWIIPKVNKIREKENEISSKVKAYIENASLEIGSLYFTNEDRLPTRTAIINELRILSPANATDLLKRLEEKGFNSPPERYLNRHLDALRRSGFVIRKRDKKYCLTVKALRAMGTSKNRNSKDIIRILDLARRGDIK